MRTIVRLAGIAIFFALLGAMTAQANDLTKLVKKAVEESTLNQPGTKPFHLKAEFAPSFERDNETHRTGVIEIWWESPTQWRREVRSSQFNQITVEDGEKIWQKNDGDYFPHWLSELAVAIVRPLPLPMDVLLQRVKTAEVRHIFGQTNIDWDSISGPGDARSNGKGYLALTDNTGLLSYTGGPGWNGQYHDFKDFHGRKIARTIASGFLELTAKVSVLEELGPTPNGFFDANAPGGDALAIDSVYLDEAELSKNLLPGNPIVWPPLTDGPLEGVVWTEVEVDRTGKIRDIHRPISDNPGLEVAADQIFRAMRFQPFLRNGLPVQAIGRVSLRFKTVRPPGVEAFDSARNYFERGRKASFLSAGASAPYILRAEFQAGTHDGVQTGRYVDTWMSATEWKREAWIGSSHLVRTMTGEKNYLISEGPNAALLRLVMGFIEPIPSVETMTESDWRIKRETINGTKTIRVFRGPEGPNGELDPGYSNGYWFDEQGRLVKSYTQGFEINQLNVEAYNGVDLARQIDVLQGGKLVMRVVVKEIGPTDAEAAKDFKLKGHESQHIFTAETR